MLVCLYELEQTFSRDIEAVRRSILALVLQLLDTFEMPHRKSGVVGATVTPI
jgi:hypothetical protein